MLNYNTLNYLNISLKKTILPLFIVIFFIFPIVQSHHFAYAKCKKHRQSCSSSSECCSRYCKKNICYKNCRQNGFPCKKHQECCSKYCQHSRCSGSCLPKKAFCKNNLQCCSGKCSKKQCQAGKFLTLCDPIKCQKWSSYKKLCLSQCKNTQFCFWGQCKQILSSQIITSRIRKKRFRHKKSTRKHKQTARLARKIKKITRKIKKIKRIKKHHCSKHNCMILKKNRCINRCKKNQHCHHGHCIPRKKIKKQCDPQKCLNFDTQIKHCYSICPPTTQCNGKGQCISKNPKCLLNKCQIFDRSIDKCISFCHVYQYCYQGKCFNLPYCNERFCLVYDPNLKRCVSFCSNHTKCDKRGHCIPLQNKQKCNKNKCFMNGYNGSCVYYCTPDQLCYNGQCLNPDP